MATEQIDTDAIRDAAKRLGVQETARRLGIGRQTLAALLAGLPVQRGTLALVAKALEDSNALA